MASRSNQEMLQPGAIAPSFELPGLGGQRISLSEELQKGPVLLFFFKVSCPVCQMAAPFVQRLSATTSFQVLGISQDGAEATGEFNTAAGISFPVLLDESRARYMVSNAYRISSVPSLFFIEPDGLISTAFFGFSEADFEDLGDRAGIAPFLPRDRAPAFRAG